MTNSPDRAHPKTPLREFAADRAAVVFGAGAVATIVALALGPAPLFVLGAALMLVGAAAPAWTWLSASGTSVMRDLPAARVVEGEPLEATLTVRGGRAGLPTGEVQDSLAYERVRLPRGRNARLRVVARFERRGLRTLDPPALVVHDPLELTRAVSVSPQPSQELLVLPRTEPVRAVGSGGTRTIGVLGKSIDMLAAVELDGLRAYTPGTPASRIHWPALARGAGLLERKLRVAGDTVPLVVLDARGPESPRSGSDHLDAAVRAAASLTLELARARGARLLLPGDRRALEISPNLLAWPSAHARLAVIEGGPETRAPSPSAMQSALGPLFYVTATRLERPPATVRPGHGRPVIVVVPDALVSPSLGAAVFTVAGCVGLRVGARETGVPGAGGPPGSGDALAAPRRRAAGARSR